MPFSDKRHSICSPAVAFVHGTAGLPFMYQQGSVLPSWPCWPATDIIKPLWPEMNWQHSAIITTAAAVVSVIVFIMRNTGPPSASHPWRAHFYGFTLFLQPVKECKLLLQFWGSLWCISLQSNTPNQKERECVLAKITIILVGQHSSRPALVTANAL